MKRFVVFLACATACMAALNGCQIVSDYQHPKLSFGYNTQMPLYVAQDTDVSACFASKPAESSVESSITDYLEVSVTGVLSTEVWEQPQTQAQYRLAGCFETAASKASEMVADASVSHSY